MLKIGLIGCGRISGKHIAAAAKNKDILQLSALCDIDASNAEKKHRKVTYSRRLRGGGFFFDSRSRLSIRKLTPCVPRFYVSNSS